MLPADCLLFPEDGYSTFPRNFMNVYEIPQLLSLKIQVFITIVVRKSSQTKGFSLHVEEL
jgi:hypothetical protein